MWEDYYAILEASPCDSFDEIFEKYKKAVEKAVARRRAGENVDDLLLRIDEASRILFFEHSRNIYDEEYKKYISEKKSFLGVEEDFHYEVQNNPDLEQQIIEAKRLAPTTVEDIEVVLSPPLKEIIKEGAKNTLLSFYHFFRNLFRKK